MRVLITGATGLVGGEIVKKCHAESIDVHYLTTSKDKISSKKNYQGFYWSPKKQEIDLACLQGVDAIINLAGAPISKRWTDSYKKEILQSRIESLNLLYDSLSKQSDSVEHLVSASAIGVYSNSLTNYYEEDTQTVSDTFLGEVVEQWEAAADKFRTLSIKVSKVRIGLVLAEDGGALPQMAKPINYGLGAPFGSGDQWQSWIQVADLAGIFVHLLENKLEGIYNGVAPNPVTNSELTKSIASVLDKPLLLPNIPKFAMKLVLGEMHILLFESQRVCAKKISESGYNFEYANLRPALEDILG